VPRKRSLTSTLYWAARLSNNVRAASRGPGAYARRVVRRKTYSKSMGATGRLLRIFGLK
jgi:steroid 5-alpha reductase family enzyme